MTPYITLALSDGPGASAYGGIPEFVLVLAAALLLARGGGRLARGCGQPEVLGELLAGIAVSAFGALAGDLSWTRWIAAARLPASHLAVAAELGAMLLLFEVGLGLRPAELRATGPRAAAVATLGIAAPFALGYLACWLFPHVYPVGVPQVHLHLFVAATLAATSVGLTARVFGDAGRLHTPEARLVLSAAVIDDILGLLVLAMVSGLVVGGAGGTAGPWQLPGIAANALSFLVLTLWVGARLLPWVMRQLARLGGREAGLVAALVVCLVVAHAAAQAGLALIVGAFLSGLVIDERHVEPFRRPAWGLRPAVEVLQDRLAPVAAILVPLFFFSIGLGVHVERFGSWRVMGFAGALTLAAIVGKLACGLAATGPLRSRLIVGICMVPRGEVGLIFAAAGAALGVIADDVFAAVVLMVVVTTVVAPWMLLRAMGEGPSSRASAADSGGDDA